MPLEELPELPPFRYRQPLLTDVEDVEKYVPGGYHPVDIGDVIGTGEQAYKVMHKLGYGGFSTVWLVRSCTLMPACFALKILCADVGDISELSVLQHLRNVAGSRHPNVVALCDSFKISGPNGEHRCLVFPVYGPSLRLTKVAKALSDSTRHQVCKQVASAMAFLHYHGVCHGDLTLSNIIFELPDIQSISPAGISQLLSPIVAENLRQARQPKGSRSPHAPKQVIQTANFSGLDYSLLTRILIIDFGQAFFAENPPPSLGVPIEFFPPELCFGYLPSTKSDIWHLACVLYQIHSIKFLFPTGFRVFEILIGTIISYLGPIPQYWKGRFNYDEYGYHELGRELDKTDPEWWFTDQYSNKSINSRLEQEAPHLPPRQREEFVRLLNDMLTYEPEKRLSAVDIMARLDELGQVIV